VLLCAGGVAPGETGRGWPDGVAPVSDGLPAAPDPSHGGAEGTGPGVEGAIGPGDAGFPFAAAGWRGCGDGGGGETGSHVRAALGGGTGGQGGAGGVGAAGGSNENGSDAAGMPRRG